MGFKSLTVSIVLLLSAQSFAIITQGNYQNVPNPGEVVGRWGSNASCVAVGEQLVLTTCHQGGGVGTSIKIAGETYRATDVHQFGDADIRLVKIETLTGQAANLSDYVGIYSGSTEQNYVATIGGFGRVSGNPLTTDGVEYGYAWGSSSNEIVWGTNKVTDLTDSAITGNFNELGTSRATEFEAAPALGDSGGGWFIQVDGEWQVAGLFRTVERYSETWFRNGYNTAYPHPDTFTALRVTNYASIIDEAVVDMVPEPMSMGIFGVTSLFVVLNRRKLS